MPILGSPLSQPCSHTDLMTQAGSGYYQQLDDPKSSRDISETWIVSLDKRNGTYAFRRNMPEAQRRD